MSVHHPSGPDVEEQPGLTDSYFNLSREIIARHGDAEVQYAVFMRRPVTLAGKMATDWLQDMAKARGGSVKIEGLHAEGAWVGAGEPMFYISGSMQMLVDLETIFLQRLGAACVAAYNAYQMCVDLPNVSFLAMDARHCAGAEMADLMAYGASVGSNKAKAKTDAIGFIGCAADATAHFFGQNTVWARCHMRLSAMQEAQLRQLDCSMKHIQSVPLRFLLTILELRLMTVWQWQNSSQNLLPQDI